MRTETDAAPFRNDIGYPQPSRSVHRRDAEPEDDDRAERDEVEGTPAVRGDLVERQLVAGRNLMEPRESDAA